MSAGMHPRVATAYARTREHLAYLSTLRFVGHDHGGAT